MHCLHLKHLLYFIDDNLHRLANEMWDSKGRTYVCSIETFDFIVCEYVLQILDPVLECLQAKDSDLIWAIKETKAVYSTIIQNKRNDDLVWDALYALAVEYAAIIDVEPSSHKYANRLYILLFDN